MVTKENQRMMKHKFVLYKYVKKDDALVMSLVQEQSITRGSDDLRFSSLIGVLS